MRDEHFFTYSDVALLMRRHRRVLFLSSLFFICCFLIFAGSKGPKYRADGLFKHEQSRDDAGYSVEALMKNLSSIGQGGEARTLFQCRTIIYPLVEYFGLQVEVKESSFLRNIRDLLRAEFLSPLSAVDRFSFTDVIYHKDDPLEIDLLFRTPSNYVAIDKSGEEIFTGRVGHEIENAYIHWVLESVPKNLKLNHRYSVKVQPWQIVAKKLAKKIDVRLNKSNKRIVELSYSDRDREKARLLLRALMGSFQLHIERDASEVAKQQFEFLDQRQQELFAHLNQFLDAHVDFLKQNWGTDGFIDTEKQIAAVAKTQEEYLNRLLDLDIEQKRFEKSGGLRKQKTAVNKNELSGALQTFSRVSSEIENPGNDQRLISNELERAARTVLLSLHRNPSSNPNVQAIDPISVKELYIRYNDQLDRVSLEMKQLFFAIDKLRSPNFELTGLKALLPDSINPLLLDELGQLSLHLHDRANWSDKEISRTHKQLDARREQIIDQLNQQIDLLQIKVDLIEDKISDLRNSSLNLIQSEKKLIKDKLSDLSDKLKDVPEKWRFENELKTQTAFARTIVEGMRRLIENKAIEHQLKVLGSKELDPPFASVRPAYPFLFLKAFVFGSFGYLLMLFLLGTRDLKRGLPLTLSTLQLHTPFVFGRGVLEHFVRLSKGKVIAILGEGNSGEALAQLFEERGNRVYLIKAEERVFCREFQERLSNLKQEYDKVICVFDWSIACSPAYEFAALSDCTLVTICSERLDQIKFYLNLNQGQEDPRAIFAFHSS